DAHARRDPSPKTAPPAHPDERFEPPALYQPAQCHALATSEMFLRRSSSIQSRPRARSAALRRNTCRTPALPACAARPARRTDCCPTCFVHLHRGSASSATLRRLSRAPPASASRRLRHPDVHPPASAAPSSVTAATSASAPPLLCPAGGVHITIDRMIIMIAGRL